MKTLFDEDGMTTNYRAACIVFAAGKGSRMTGYAGNKTLLPLVPGASIFDGSRSLLEEVLENLPPGPRGVVVHHRAQEVEAATRDRRLTYIPQPVTNGTGGALLAARKFLETVTEAFVVITMGDVPLIRPETYAQLVGALDGNALSVLAFEPQDRGQYGMLEMDGDQVLRIVEWKYWKDFSPEEAARLRTCNAGVYAARRSALLDCLDALASRPHRVNKVHDGRPVVIEEYFLTDIVELMLEAGLSVGTTLAAPEEVTGVDTPEALRIVQERFAARSGAS